MNPLQEQVNQQAVTLTTRGATITARMLARAMRAFLQQSRTAKQRRVSERTAKKAAVGKTGLISMRSLSRGGASLENIEITGDNIGSFKRIARKYNVAFSLKRDHAADPPRWVVFFKAKDTKSLELAFAEYTKENLRLKSRKPRLKAQIEKASQRVKTQAEPAKNRSRSGIEL